MTVKQLKEILNRFNVKTKETKKSKIIEECAQLLSKKFPGSATTVDDLDPEAKEGTISEKRRMRVLAPVSSDTSSAMAFDGQTSSNSSSRFPTGDKRDSRLGDRPSKFLKLYRMTS
jgi:hypothetical protein